MDGASGETIRVFAQTARKRMQQAWDGLVTLLMKPPPGAAAPTVAVQDPRSLLKNAQDAVRGHLALVFWFSAAINLLYLAPSIYMMQVYDRVLPTAGLLTLVFLSIVLVMSLAVMAALDALRARVLARASLRVERIASAAVISRSMALRRAGNPVVPGVRELDTLRGGLSSPAAIGLADLPWTPIYVLVAFMLHPIIGCLALVGAAIIFGLALANERAQRAGMETMTAKAPLFYAAHESDMQAAETLHAIGAERAMLARRLRAREELIEAQNAVAFRNAAFSSGTKAARLLLQSTALCVGAYLVVNRQMSAGSIMAASILTARAYAPLEQIVGGWRQLAQSLAAYRSLQKLFANSPESMARTPLPAPKGRIVLEQVAAAPPGRKSPAIQGVSMVAEPGQIIGVVGESGAGKSTLARVLANAAPLMNGSVRIDGARYCDWDSNALASHIGYLPQRVDLCDGTVAENISCFAAERGESAEQVGQQVVAAAMLAGAHDLILSLPRGYDTPLGLGGAGVSPGQAQRIALARALYGEPRVLVLDEPNAHLDAEGELALVDALNAVKARGGVAFVIAHRAGVLGIADMLAIVSQGRLVEYGPRAAVQQQIADAQKTRNNVVPMREAATRAGA